MRFYKVLILCLVSSMAFAQFDVTTSGNGNVGTNATGLWVVSNGTTDKIDGSLYLYDSWFNNGKIYFGGKKLSTASLNYNMKLERFESRVSEDSVFAIDPSSAKKIEIRGAEFIRTLDPEFRRNSYFEKIATINDRVLLEKHIVELKLGQINPLTLQKMKKDTFIKKQKFYLANKEGENLKDFKLSKKMVLSLLDKNKVNMVKQFVKEKKLSYKKLKDIQTLLMYSKSI